MPSWPQVQRPAIQRPAIQPKTAGLPAVRATRFQRGHVGVRRIRGTALGIGIGLALLALVLGLALLALVLGLALIALAFALSSWRATILIYWPWNTTPFSLRNRKTNIDFGVGHVSRR